MIRPITKIEIRYEQDVVYARSRARIIAETLGFDKNDQTRISTAVSEIARNAFQYAHGGEVGFFLDDKKYPPAMQVIVQDKGEGIPNLPEILNGNYVSKTGMGYGIAGAKRLMDSVSIDTTPGGGTTVTMGKILPKPALPITPEKLSQVAQKLVENGQHTPFEEIRVQNLELMRTMDELRRQKEALVDANIRLQEIDRLKSMFIATMSHELRTPLNSIIGFTGILIKGIVGPLTPEQKKQLGMVQKSARHLLALINDVIDISKIEAGKVELDPEEFDLLTLVADVVREVEPRADERGLRCTAQVPTGPVTVVTDERRVRQIILNIAGNAVKYTDAGSVSITVSNRDDMVVVTVRDTGIGISAEDQQHLFEAFVRFPVPGRIVEGTGLGLYLSQKLARMLGGRIDAVSEPGAGSIFIFTFPKELPEGSR